MSEKHWEVFDVIIGGKSIIDSSMGLAGFVQDREEASRFVKSYGYDLEDPIELAESLGHFQEALSFVRRFFLAPENPDGLRLEIPRKVTELTDLRDLVLMAGMAYPGQTSDSPGVLASKWACALLKVIHTIAHIDKDVRSFYYADVQKSILDRFYRVVHRDANGQLQLGNKPEERIPLVAFETKPRKTRDSVLLKLLQKPENVADEIFDRVGVRFVTRSIRDALRVVEFLADQNVIVAANVKPSRSRNTLVDLSKVRSILEGAPTLAGASETFGEGFESTTDPSIQNPHSSSHYRAIQFTCRQLIKFRNPLFDQLKEVKQAAKNQTGELATRVDQIDLAYLHREVKFFYPFEVQVLDEKSHLQNEEGRSAHSDYKKSQLQTALRRVMGSLVEHTSPTQK